MIVELPSPEERAAILQKNAARFPQSFDFALAADGGKLDTLKLVLGSPPKDSPAWERAVAATFKPKTVQSDEKALVSECIIWPDQATWGGILRRWPALPQTVGKILRKKLGGDLSALEEPSFGEEPPAIIKTTQATNAAVVWRRLKIESETIDVAVQPPDQAVWEMFHDRISEASAKCWPLALDFAAACVAASTHPISALFERRPGAALLIALTASTLAGLAVEVQQGEF